MLEEYKCSFCVLLRHSIAVAEHQRRRRAGRATCTNVRHANGAAASREPAAACRTFLTLYTTFVYEVTQSLNEQDEAFREGHDAADIDWPEIRHKLKSTLPSIAFESVREWATEGIRIYYARQVYSNCNRRLVWKLLKGGLPCLRCPAALPTRVLARPRRCRHVRARCVDMALEHLSKSPVQAQRTRRGASSRDVASPPFRA